MRRVAEAALFLGLAAMLHAAAFWAWPGEGSQAGEEAGERTALIGAGPEMAALVAAWEQEPKTLMPDARPQAEATTGAVPDASDVMSSASPGPSPGSTPPIRDRAPPRLSEPEPQVRAKATMRPPMARPARKPAPPPVKIEMRAAPTVSRGSGPASRPEENDVDEELTADEAGAARSPDRGGAAMLIQAWGGAIRRAIEARRGAAGLIRRTRTARVALTVARSGALLSSSLQDSSGSAALDKAALQAVSAAAPYPPAPGGLTGASFDFALPVVFRR